VIGINQPQKGNSFQQDPVDGSEVARTAVKRTVPAAFTASETFDVGTDLGSPVSGDYFDHKPFQFNGKIEKVEVKLK
jgi:arylsulfatase